ncbi:aminotransferase class I/II-fold pyridoxal phosphate-dependent enzyme [Pseudonocardia sp. CA-107938]|uniref:aminotransferase class I/II-fold pyridoxal phosphate-dependent enzyme n=1 Tax=Pseudonocardia sp. CA-107938 TaxID=3240021 RepID=UPI003D920B82
MIRAALDEALAAHARREEVVGAGRPGRVARGGRELVNMASCDYLGLARHPDVLRAAHAALDEWGLGAGAGRVLSGTTAMHRELEQRLAQWVGAQDAVLHPSCWTANAGVLGVVSGLARRDGRPLALFSDRLNHASIIDGIRAQRAAVDLTLYDHDDDHAVLRRGLAAAPADSTRVIITDGVFSMEGDQAALPLLTDLADEHEALLIVDDSHGTGVVGPQGRGTAEAQGVLGDVDVVTGTLGKALGGAIGGFVAGPHHLTNAVRALSRPYTFSNNPPPSVVAGALAALDVLAGPDSPLPVLRDRTRRLRAGIAELGLPTFPGEHPIVPIVVGDETAAATVSTTLIDAGIFAPALTYPIVPRGEARLRLQVSAAHDDADIDTALTAIADSAPPSARA